MNLRELAARRIAGEASASLTPLSPQEVQKVTGAIYYGPTPHSPFPGPGPYPGPEWPFPGPIRFPV